MPSSRYERAARKSGYRTIAGLDEAGRGALFGPVFAAAVVLDPDRPIRGLDDSKQLEPERRQVLAQRIRERAVAWALGAADAFEIDRIDTRTRQGWSVLVRGKLHHANAPAAESRCVFDSQPWLAAARDSWLLIEPALISGRRLSREPADFESQ